MFKVVFHISDVEKWPALLNNVRNFLQGAPAERTLIVIANGPGIQGYLQSEIVEQIWTLHNEGAHFDVCKNSLIGQDVAKEHLPECVEIVPAAVIALVEYQQKGYAYIKP